MQQVYEETISEFIHIASLSLRIDDYDSYLKRSASILSDEQLLDENLVLNEGFIFIAQLSSHVSAQLTKEFGIRILIIPSAISPGSWDIKEWISIDGKQLRTAVLAAWISSLPGGILPEDLPKPDVPTTQQVQMFQDKICEGVEYRYRKIIQEDNKMMVSELSICKSEPEEISSNIIRKFMI